MAERVACEAHDFEQRASVEPLGDIIQVAETLGVTANVCLLAAEDRRFSRSYALDLGIQCCDVAERILQKAAARRLFEDDGSDIPLITQHHTPIQYVSKMLQWERAGRPELDAGLPGQDIRLWFFYFRSFESVRRYEVENRYRGGLKEFFDLGFEPPIISLEGAIHRAVAYRVCTRTLAGSFDIFGMPKIFYAISYTESPFHWQELVSMLMVDADGAFILPSNGPSTIWEIRFLVASHKSKTLIVISIPEKYEAMAYSHYSQCSDIFQDQGVAFPTYDPLGSLVIIRGNSVVKLPFDAMFDNSLLSKILEVTPFRGAS